MALTIGQVAKAAHVNVETLRYYERRGLVPRPPRSLLGFSLQEIRELLSLRATPKARCSDVKRRAETKLGEIEAKVRALRAMSSALRRLVSQCEGELPASACPILESLDERRRGV